MTNIDLKNFHVVKTGNIDNERNYINDILHALADQLTSLETQIASITGGSAGGGGSPPDASYVVASPEAELSGSRLLQGESGVIGVADGGTTATVGVLASGISTTKLANSAVTIPKINASGTPDATTFLRGDAAWAMATGDLSYTHVQSTSAATWTINHNLGKYPSISVVDSGGSWVVGSVDYTTINQCTVTFAGGFSGKAFCN